MIRIANVSHIAIAAALYCSCPEFADAAADQSGVTLTRSERLELVRLRKENALLRQRLARKSPTPIRRASQTPPADHHPDQSTAATPVSPPYSDAVSPAELYKKHPAQNLFIRSAPLDAFYYLYSYGTTPNVQGASASLTRDDVAQTTSVTLQGFASYVIFRPDLPNPSINGDPSLSHVRSNLGLSAFASAPFVYVNGTLNEPFKSTEKSALQFGADNQFELSGGGFFPIQDLSVRPYYQTDFRGRASIEGVAGLYEPYLPVARLGVNDDAGPQLLGFYFRTIGELDAYRVNTAGLTTYTSDTTYTFVGGTAQFNAVLFQNMPDAPLGLCGRVRLNTAYYYFADALRNGSFGDLHSELSIDLGGKPTAFCVLPGTTPPTPAESTSLAFSYDDGTDKSTLTYAKKYQLKLTYKY